MTYASEVLADSPELFWECYESTALEYGADSSGNGYRNEANGNGNCFLGGTALAGFSGSPYSLRGQDGGGYRATEGNSNITALDVGTGDFAFEWWQICTNSTGNYVQVIGRDSSATGNGQLIYLNIGDGTVRAYCAGTAINGTTRVSDSALHHIVVERDSGVLKIWVDGVLENSASATGNTDSPGGRAFRFGMIDGSYSAFNGNAACIAYYTHALGSTRIAAHYSAGVDSDVNAVLQATWGSWSATASFKRDVHATLQGSWGSWVADAAFEVDTPVEVSAVFQATWGSWSASAAFTVDANLPGPGSVRVDYMLYRAAINSTSPSTTLEFPADTTTASTFGLLYPDESTYDASDHTVTFEIARNGFNVASVACTLTDAGDGLGTFTFPALTAGTYTARFVAELDGDLASFPTAPLTIKVVD